MVNGFPCGCREERGKCEQRFARGVQKVKEGEARLGVVMWSRCDNGSTLPRP